MIQPCAVTEMIPVVQNMKLFVCCSSRGERGAVHSVHGQIWAQLWEQGGHGGGRRLQHVLRTQQRDDGAVQKPGRALRAAAERHTAEEVC